MTWHQTYKALSGSDHPAEPAEEYKLIEQDRQANALLKRLPDDDFALLAPHLTRAALARGEDLINPGDVLRQCWFPLGGMISVVALAADDVQAEVGIVGREGFVSASNIHRVKQGTLHYFVQIPGAALRIPYEKYKEIVAVSPAFDRLMLIYAETFLIQISHTALAYASRTIDQRLARWLLMSLDRTDDAEVPLTHEQLALMLGVRRAGVTVAVNALEQADIVAARRGVITVIDRERLAKRAGVSYGTPEAEYRMMLDAA